METNNNEEKTRAEIYLNPDTKKFKEGNPGGGRPKGSMSIKDAVRKHLEDNPNDFQEFVKHFIENNRELAWQMLEGKPHQSADTKHEVGDNLSEILRNALNAGGSNQS